MSRTLRHALLNKPELPTHWKASAYLLTTLIEQKILRHYSAPSLTQHIDAGIGVSEIDRLHSIDPEAQLEYLDNVMEGAHE